VPCLRRATSLAYTDADEDAERLLNFADAGDAVNKEDEWVETHAGRQSHLDSGANPGVIDDIPDLDGGHDDDALAAGVQGIALGGAKADETPDLDDIPDMEEDLEEDDAAAAPSKPAPASTAVLEARCVDLSVMGAYREPTRLPHQ
jgi:ubiquitin-like-conjugating enzyme ATG3